MEESFESPARFATSWTPVSPVALSKDSVKRITEDLLRARRPLVVTSYLGRNSDAVLQLTSLCERLGIGVLESVPNYMNFPHNNVLYLGNQWNGAHQNPILADADVILVMDSDVPWIPLINRPSEQAIIHHVDIDPLKLQMPLSAVATRNIYQADAVLALRDINDYLASCEISLAEVEERRAHYRKLHRRRGEVLREKEQPKSDVITPEYLTVCVRDRLGDDSIVMNEGISNYQTITDHLRMCRPGSIFTSGGGSLGWNGGAAIGAKLAFPEKTVVALTGDGTYMMSIPSSVHWMARRYKAPFLQIIYNNGGWKSPKLSTLALHPDGYASKADDIGVAFAEPPDYAALAVAAGAGFGRMVTHPRDLEETLDVALRTVREEQRAAVVDVRVPEL
jgi:acetolactate synthase-1/2/3 large subunit